MTFELSDGTAVDRILVIGETGEPDEPAAHEIAASEVDRRNGVRADLRMHPFRRVRRAAEVGLA